MGKYFNIAGPCNPLDHYMLSATARLPRVMRLIEDKAYFVLHAPRQCGKTTAFRALTDEINARGDGVAMYCSLEVVQAFPDPDRTRPWEEKIYAKDIVWGGKTLHLVGC